MNHGVPLLGATLAAGIAAAYGARGSVVARAGTGRTITVATAGPADVVGSDSAALQRGADMLHPGDVLSIAPGTYRMDDSLRIPSGVTVRGTPGKTVLLKSAGVASALAEDGDYGESDLVVAEPQKFRPGMGVEILDDALSAAWDVSVSRVVAVEGRVVRIEPRTVRDYDLQQRHARIRNTFPILVAANAEGVTFEDIVVDGNRAENEYIDGCRGGAIYMYDVRNATVRNCVARNYNGDGISFQITQDVHVVGCESYGNSGYGVHPGTGSARPLVEGCRLHDNGDIGLFLCWRVRHGVFRNNVIEGNGHYGISIGHKDTDNLFVDNLVARNGVSGVYFREETYLNSGHRNTFRGNEVLDNGNAREGYGFYVAPHAEDIVINGNRVAETRADGRTQRYGVYKVKGAGTVRMDGNTVEGNTVAAYAEGGPRPE